MVLSLTFVLRLFHMFCDSVSRQFVQAEMQEGKGACQSVFYLQQLLVAQEKCSAISQAWAMQMLHICPF